MNRYVIGIIAIITAVSAAAFTKPNHLVDMYVFEFDNTQAYTTTNVANTSNTYWKYKGKNLSLCNNTNEKACRVAVTSAFVDNPSSPTALSGGVSITAALSGSIAYVSSITGTGNVRSNQNQ